MSIIPGMGMVPAFIAGGGVGPPPTFVAASANGNGSTAAMPSGWAVGDLLIIVATARDGYDGMYITYTTPSGWTKLGICYGSHASNESQVFGTSVFYRIAQSGDSTITLGLNPSGVKHSSYMLAYRGVDAAAPFEASLAKGYQAFTSTVPYSQITTLGPNRVAVHLITGWTVGAGTSSSPATGWSTRFALYDALNTTVVDRSFASAGLTSAGNQTYDDGVRWGCMSFAIKPSPG